MGRLTNKVAFIAGSTAGIGRVAAELFAREGAKVMVSGRRVSEGEETVAAIQEAGGEARFVTLDVSEPESVARAINTTVEAYGRLDVLFNNAGGSSSADGKVTEVALEEFWRVIKVDLFGTFLCCRFAIPEIIKAGGGSVINNASLAGLHGTSGRDAYTAAKGGVIALTRSMSAEFTAERVRVNAIAPGGVKTERIAALMEKSAAAREGVKVQPFGLIDPLEIAYAAVYLASDESKFTTGSILQVSGGR
jgi:NAD(P)-dependent dehydrogenase (short-subunit alcohol dehydrogenase family)